VNHLKYWVVFAWLGLSACQVASGLSDLEVEDCPGLGSAACSLSPDCGCSEGEHCQAQGTELTPTCVAQGNVAIGGRCTAAEDCQSGTCDQQACREYCTDACASANDRCVPATGADNKVLADIHVCATSCEIGNSANCSAGTTCQELTLGGVTGAFCAPPANPCPTTGDGVCDEPDKCEAGTDAEDCSCPQLFEDGECNPVEQCGCNNNAGELCYMGVGSAATDFKPRCAIPGKLAEGEECTGTFPQCADGMGCFGQGSGRCRKYCQSDEDCPDTQQCVDTDVPTDDSAYPQLRICLTTTPATRAFCELAVRCGVDLTQAECESGYASRESQLASCGTYNTCDGLYDCFCKVYPESDGCSAIAATQNFCKVGIACGLETTQTQCESDYGSYESKFAACNTYSTCADWATCACQAFPDLESCP